MAEHLCYTCMADGTYFLKCIFWYRIPNLLKSVQQMRLNIRYALFFNTYHSQPPLVLMLQFLYVVLCISLHLKLQFWD